MNELLRRLFNLPVQASSFAADIDFLHYVIIVTTIVGAFGVAFSIGLFSLRHPSRVRPPKQKATRATLVFEEVAAVAVLLIFFVSVWLAGYRQFVTLRTPPADALDIYVIGKQWMWAFAYPDGTITNGDVYVPVHRPIRLIMTSRDVIHSFYVPAFRTKQDLLPGRMTVTWFEAVREGAYDILCAEYCGLSHSLMRGRVVVLGPSEFEAWQRGQQESRLVTSHAPGPIVGSRPLPTPASLAAYGQRVAATRGCLRCHTLDGTPHLGPSFAGVYMSQVALSDGASIVADDAYLTESIMDPAARHRAGFQPIMPSYFGQLTASEIAGLVELIHTLREVRGAPGEPLAAPGAGPQGAELLPRSPQSSVLKGRPAGEVLAQEMRE